MAKKGLGKGLQALIPPTPPEQGDENSIAWLELSDIKPNAYQPRREFDEVKLRELAESIREHGIVQPIVVRRTADGTFELVAGERRWRACQMVGLEKIPAVIKDLEDREITEIALIENIQREDLNPLEEAWAYKTLIEEFGLTQEQVSQRVGRSRPFIANMLRLLNLSQQVQTFVAQGQLSVGHARALLAVTDPAEQVLLAQQVVQDGLTVRQTEELVKNRGQQPEIGPGRVKKKKKHAQNAHPLVPIWEEKLQSVLGTKVRIQQKEQKGKIEIEFYSEEELTRLIEVIMGEEEF